MSSSSQYQKPIEILFPKTLAELKAANGDYYIEYQGSKINWVSGSTKTADNVLVFLRDGFVNGRFEREITDNTILDVWFNGTDAEKIQAALDTGFHVLLEPRSYDIGATSLVKIKEGQRLDGIENKTVINYDGDIALDFVGPHGSIGLIQNQSVSNIEFIQTSDYPSFTFTNTAVDTAADTITVTGHNFSDGDRIVFGAIDPSDTMFGYFPVDESNSTLRVATVQERATFGRVYYAKVIDANTIKVCCLRNGGTAIGSILHEYDLTARGSSGNYTVRKLKTAININGTKYWEFRNVKFQHCDINYWGGRYAYGYHANSPQLTGSHYGDIKNSKSVGATCDMVWSAGCNEICVDDSSFQEAELFYQSVVSGFTTNNTQAEGVNYGNHFYHDIGASSHRSRFEGSSQVPGLSLNPYYGFGATWCSILSHSGTTAAQTIAYHDETDVQLEVIAGNRAKLLKNQSIRMIRDGVSANALSIRSLASGPVDDFVALSNGTFRWGNGFDPVNSKLSRASNGRMDFELDGNAPLGIERPDATTGTKTLMSFLVGGTTIGSIASDAGNAVIFNTTSDRRKKKNLTGVDHKILDGVAPYFFNWKSNDEKSIGIMAQDVKKVLPLAVTTGSEGELSVDYIKLIPLLIAKVKYLEARLNET